MTNRYQLGRSIYLVFFSLLLAFCVPTFASTPKLQEQLGVKNLNILKNAKFVTILTMVPEGARNKYGSIKEVHLSNDEMEKLKRNLLDDHNYDFGRTKSCHFVPEISFKFEDDQEQVLYLFVSPSCNQMLFGMGTHSALLNYDPAYERLEYFLLHLVAETRNRNKEMVKWN